jgi:tripartite-type tricarboxylate transporter receptor subunit TctC
MSKGCEKNKKRGAIKSLTKLCLLLIPFLLFLAPARGAEYPTKTIQLVSNFPPGGSTDIVARILQKKLSTLLGQPVPVVNKAGGGGTVGIQSVAAAPADGYTILASTPTIVISPLTVKGLPFSFRDFSPVNLAVYMPSVVSVKKESPWKSLEELISDAKKNPGKLTYSSPGPGTLAHLAGELFKMATGTEITHIPMDGAAKAMTAALGGHVNMTFVVYGGLKTYLEAGSLRALAVMSASHLEEFPNVPTTVEKGYPKVVSGAWVGFFVSAKTSSAIVKKLGEAFIEALKDKEIIGLLKNAGYTVDNLGPEESAKFLAEEEERCLQVIKAAKIGQ